MPEKSKQSVRTRTIKGGIYRSPGTKTVTKTKTVGPNNQVTKTRKVVRTKDNYRTTSLARNVADEMKNWRAGGYGRQGLASQKDTFVKTKTKEKNVGGKGVRRSSTLIEKNMNRKGVEGETFARKKPVDASSYDKTRTTSAVKTKTSGPGYKTKVKEGFDTSKGGKVSYGKARRGIAAGKALSGRILGSVIKKNK